MPASTPEYRSGFAALVGRPNVGKSTLLNRLVGQKIAITSDKPQTTRNRILGVINRPHAQLILIDTPGIHRPHHKLGAHMVRVATATMAEVDVILFVVDASAPKPGPGDGFISRRLVDARTPVLLILNKVDRVPPQSLGEVAARYEALGDFEATFAISALRGDNLENLADAAAALMPPGPMYYPPGMVTDQPEQLLVAEFIREKILLLTEEEIPHSVAVEITEMAPRSPDLVFVRAVIYVDRESQKGIIIGDGGKRIKEIGRLARIDLEHLLGTRFYLELWLKVKKGWRDRPSILNELGYRS